MHRRAFLLAPFALGLVPAPVHAARLASIPVGPHFVNLHQRLLGITGTCLGVEQDDPATGDISQPTTTGLLVWRKADRVATFTNGSLTWLAGPTGLQRRSNAQRYAWEVATGGGAELFGPTYLGLTGVQPYAQRHILSCESAAASVALRLTGHDVSEETMLALLPMDSRQPLLEHGTVRQWGDPNRAFVGRVDGWFPWTANGTAKAGTHGWGYGVYAGPLLQAVRTVAPAATGGTAVSTAMLAAALQRGRPAVVWLPDRTQYLKKRARALQVGQWTSWDGASVRFSYDEHAQVLLGMDATHVILGNVGYQATHGPFLSIWPRAEFNQAYATLGRMAVLV